MTVSGFPSYSTVTFTVKGMPAVVVDGATKSRVACVVPQPDAIVATITAVKAQIRTISITGGELSPEGVRPTVDIRFRPSLRLSNGASPAVCFPTPGVTLRHGELFRNERLVVSKCNRRSGENQAICHPTQRVCRTHRGRSCIPAVTFGGCTRGRRELPRRVSYRADHTPDRHRRNVRIRCCNCSILNHCARTSSTKRCGDAALCPSQQHKVQRLECRPTRKPAQKKLSSAYFCQVTPGYRLGIRIPR